MRNNALHTLGKPHVEELEREGFTALDASRQRFYALRESQSRVTPKTVIVAAQLTSRGLDIGMSVVSVSVNGIDHYGPRIGVFSETWRRLVNESLLWDDIFDWMNNRADRPQRRR